MVNMKKPSENKQLKEEWGSFKKKWRQIKKNRCLFLMLSLIMLLLCYPHLLLRPILLLSLSSISLVAGVYAVSNKRKHVVIAAILGVLVFVFMLEDFVYASGSTAIFASLLLAGFYIYTLINMLVYVSSGKRVNKDKIYAALSIYMLIGFAWASLYRVIYLSDPSSFSGSQSSYMGVHHFDFIYYSFVSICTLGFGDLVPISGLARSLTILEAMTGIFFMAVMISRLVSLYKTDEEE